jgi:hypothetical protein
VSVVPVAVVLVAMAAAVAIVAVTSFKIPEFFAQSTWTSTCYRRQCSVVGGMVVVVDMVMAMIACWDGRAVYQHQHQHHHQQHYHQNH